jgi:hypothetical protein
VVALPLADRFASTRFFLVVAGGLFGLTHHILRIVRV